MTAPPRDERLDRPATSDSTARALVAAIPDPIFRIGVDGTYRGFKVDSEEDLLTPPDEVIGYSVHERLPVGVADAVHVGQEDELAGTEARRDAGRGVVGVDVADDALRVTGQRRDDRHLAPDEDRVEQVATQPDDAGNEP